MLNNSLRHRDYRITIQRYHHQPRKFCGHLQRPAMATPPSIIEPVSYNIKIDVSHGFNPEAITINKSNTIIWIDEENQRPRIVLVSKDSLFEKQLMQYPGRYEYQFNLTGKYTFIWLNIHRTKNI